MIVSKRFRKISNRLRSAGLVVLAGCLLITGSINADARKTVTQIQKEQKEVKNQIAALDSELYEVVLEVEELSTQIEEMEIEIEDTMEALISAQEASDDQYASMKIRIRYMYETPEPGVLEILLESSSISEMLNRIEYVNEVYEYDKDKMEQLNAIQMEIAELTIALDDQKIELQEAKAEMVQKQKALDAMIASKKDKLANLETELKEAKRLAAIEAARRAAAAAKLANNKNYNVGGNSNPSPVTGISGSAVVAYASQFVGCPYVWGGTSLTNGCDCSGFVQGVYRNFGITWGGRMTSVSFRNVGQEVGYANVQPGDIVCYPGHVAIYAGGGIIVEAQSTRTGITKGRSINCKSIITIRRVI